jgi:4-amino-4-deoxy-L-arabinose transferase-like glycosyltransferase
MDDPRSGADARAGSASSEDLHVPLSDFAVPAGPTAAIAVPASLPTSSGEGVRPRRSWSGFPFRAGLLVFLWLAFSIGIRKLTLPDEGRYVGVAWEMLRSGDWLIPTENGLPFFHKPPLFYWLTAASMAVFGTGPAAARFAPLLAATLGTLCLYFIARRWVGERTARWTVVALVTQPFFFGAAQFANLDMPVAACIATAILFAAHASLLIRSGLPYRRALLAAWAAAALGVLAKGLIGLVLPCLVVLAWLLLSGQRRTILRLLWPGGPALFALIVAPWFIAVQHRYPGFAHFFFVYQHFERFAKGGFNNVEPWWFFFAVVAGLTLPWSLWLLRSTFGNRAGESDDATLWRRLMWVWLAVVLVFFSIPQSKPVGYAMPVLFPIAALSADAMLGAFGGLRRGVDAAHRLAVASAMTGATICLVTLGYFSLASHRDNMALAQTLLRLRAAGDPVVFVEDYFFDVPLHARLTEPVPVLSNWQDPTIAAHDNWKRELSEARVFAPQLADALLVDEQRGLALRCGSAPLWALAKDDAQGRMQAIPGAMLIQQANRAALWRITADPAACGAR